MLRRRQVAISKHSLFAIIASAMGKSIIMSMFLHAGTILLVCASVCRFCLTHCSILIILLLLVKLQIESLTQDTLKQLIGSSLDHIADVQAEYNRWKVSSDD